MPDIPTLTDDEAAVLRLRCSTFPAAGGTVLVDHWRSLAEKGLLISEDSKPTNLGRAALAAFDAERVREIRKPLVDLLDDIYDRLEDYVDVDDGSDGPTPNFAMSIRMSIDIALGRQP